MWYRVVNMAVLFFQVISWVVLTRAVRTCNQCKDLPTISTVYLYCMIIVQVFCAIMSNKLFRVRVRVRVPWVGYEWGRSQNNALCSLQFLGSYLDLSQVIFQYWRLQQQPWLYKSWHCFCQHPRLSHRWFSQWWAFIMPHVLVCLAKTQGWNRSWHRHHRWLQVLESQLLFG